MNFQDALGKCFRFNGTPERDNLPILAKSRWRIGKPGDFGRGCLAKMMGYMEFARGAEVGTFHGMSAVMWCKHNPLLTLSCVDPFTSYWGRRDQSSQDGNYEKAIVALKPFRATIIREQSLEAVRRFEDQSLDFVYIDGDHRFDQVVQDIVQWVPKVRKDGLVIIHDYCAFVRAGVMKAVDAYTHCHRIEPWYVTQDTTPTAFWRKGVERSE
jgi:predicted O-methyltransferase YrrM